ncbi:GTP-binding protein [Bradyrhizobium sp. LHD-71]|uniref:CobW family GTP-binding protein n=1 Tax=Bradyrhizobium sp. LHD-71 TaxID=3072141 RepID=UPI0028105165|nr:GTP-binding protein [Bradyrhizobium sp. LHD-71]MDQ8731507.1 GTP-binding protein [Bradyrhizobium sp. LHD-71]
MSGGPDFFVLTGFLGSGKTTLLRDFLAQPEAADTAVIVNEVGEIGLDGAILAEGANDVPISLLSNGCVCCSLGSDLAGTIESLVEARRRITAEPLRRIILETSGVSKPGPILRSLASLAPLRMRVGVVATFDCERAVELAAFEEAAAQWAGAQTLVLTKRDAVAEAGLHAAREAVRAINPLAEVIDTPDRRTAVLAAFAPVHAGDPIDAVAERWTEMPRTAPHPRIKVMLARFRQPVAWAELAAWLDNLAGLCGDKLLRVKGLVQVEGHAQRALVQSVGTLFGAPRPFAGPANDERSFLVIIARDVDQPEIAALSPRLPMIVSQLGGPSSHGGSAGIFTAQAVEPPAVTSK